MLIDPISFCIAISLSCAIVGCVHLPRLKIGINLGDEGYLWYGTLQTLEGKIPIRDFRAYDPGRYYWSAFWMLLLGRGVIHLRIVFLITQVLSLTFGILIVNFHLQNWWISIAAGIILSFVMMPLFKAFEYFFSSVAVFFALLLLHNPAPENLFLAGLFVGLSFFFGLNLGLYNFIGLSVIITFQLVITNNIQVLQLVPAYAAGIATGFLPMAAMLLLIPGMFKKYWEKKVLVIFRRGTTNLKVLYPWLWRRTPSQLRHHNKFYQGCFKVCFTLMPFTYVILLGWTLWNGQAIEPAHKVLLASLFVGIPYLHHVFARADVSHLLVGGYPLLFGLSALLFQWQFVWTVILTVLMAGCFWIASSALTVSRAKRRHYGSLVISHFGNNLLMLPKYQADYLQVIRSAVDRYSEPGDFVLFLPMFAALYPLLNRKSPAYDIFCVYQATEEAQEEMIESLSEKKVKLAVIDNYKLDGMDDRSWERTHPLVFKYLQNEYKRINTDSRFSNLLIFFKQADS